MTTEKLAVTPDQAAEALDSLDDFARMGVGVDARGPRKVLEQFIEQTRAALAATPAPAPAQAQQAEPLRASRVLDICDQLTMQAYQVRAVEAACAEAWGVKLAGQGKEAGNADPV